MLTGPGWAPRMSQGPQTISLIVTLRCNSAIRMGLPGSRVRANPVSPFVRAATKTRHSSTPRQTLEDRRGPRPGSLSNEMTSRGRSARDTGIIA